jgi:hypothetical protein
VTRLFVESGEEWYNYLAEINRLAGLFLLPDSLTSPIIVNRAVVTKAPVCLSQQQQQGKK